MADDLVRRVQRAYPQIYLACHTHHTTTASDGIGERDAAMLAHLDELAPVGVTALANHLGVGASTVTEAIDRLEAAGLVTRRRATADRRGVELRVTAAGVARMKASSVLDADRVAAVLAALGPRDRSAAVRGLELLARGARARMTAQQPKRRNP